MKSIFSKKSILGTMAVAAVCMLGTGNVQAVASATWNCGFLGLAHLLSLIHIYTPVLFPFQKFVPSK